MCAFWGRPAPSLVPYIHRISHGTLLRGHQSVALSAYIECRRSQIHGWGLFLLRDVETHEMVIEYCGEVVRGTVADEREKRYNLDHEDGGCYLFRMDADTVVDATKMGSIARFINHR